MDTVPQKVLNWLHSVLVTGYRDVNRTYNDIGHTLGAFQTIRPSTDVYTFDDGRSALLLHLTGTVPATFRGVTYSFPISIWVPHEYPAWPPMAFVTASPGMAIRPGQHVSVEGRIYHPYLANWNLDHSNMSTLLHTLAEIFSYEPPLVSRKTSQPDTNPSTHQTRPPQSLQQHSANSQSQVVPPALPPKPGQQASSLQTTKSSYSSGSNPPPRPPKGGHHESVSSANHGYTGPQQIQSPPPSQFLQRQPSVSLRRGVPGGQWQGSQALSPSETVQSHSQSLQRQQGEHQPQSPGEGLQYAQGAYHANMHQNPYQNQPQGPLQQWQQHRPPYNQAFQQQPASQPRKTETQDLLTSPFDLPLPEVSSLAVPPVPPNPEKDAILHAISLTLDAQLQNMLQANANNLPVLQAQHAALYSAQISLQQEFAHLRALEAQVQANESTLHASLKEADNCIADAKQRSVPNVDETLIAPTVLSNQLYNLVAEEKSCVAARHVLLKALDRGRLGVDQWSKNSRSIAREEWHKKWLIRRAAKGMGLQGADQSGENEKEVAGGVDNDSYYR